MPSNLPSPTPRLLSAQELAPILSMTVPGIYRAVRLGQIPARKISERRTRFILDEVLATIRPYNAEAGR